MNIFKTIFGSYLNLVVHILRATAVFIVVLGCIFVARKIVPMLFPPGDYISTVLHLVDSYAALLGTVGYVVWISLDMYFLLRERILTSGHGEENSDE
jgi:hypothetical protein